MKKNDIQDRFSVHVPDGEPNAKHKKVLAVMVTAASEINDICPETKEKHVAIAKLEEALLWANSSISRMKQKRGQKTGGQENG